jgi:hypothetical protein
MSLVYAEFRDHSHEALRSTHGHILIVPIKSYITKSFHPSHVLTCHLNLWWIDYYFVWVMVGLASSLFERSIFLCNWLSFEIVWMTDHPPCYLVELHIVMFVIVWHLDIFSLVDIYIYTLSLMFETYGLIPSLCVLKWVSCYLFPLTCLL